MILEPGLILVIKRAEGFSDHIYLDGGGVRTIGYGTTESDVSPLPSHMTEAQASAFLVRALQRKYGPAVDALRLPNPNMQNACLDLAYNCGTGILGSGFSIGRALQARDWNKAAGLFGLYIHDANGQVEPGLVTRREWERRLFIKPWVDPDPYSRYDKTVRDLHGRKISEYETAREYDHKRVHWLKWPGRLHRLKQNAGYLRERLDIVHETHGAWSGDQKWRRDTLKLRERGKRVRL